MSTRRSFLFGCLLALPVCLVQALHELSHRSELFHRAPTTAAARCLSLLSLKTAAAQAVGRRYLELHPNEAHRGPLLGKIFPQGVPETEQALGAYVESRLRTDFEDSDTVVLDGWVLSATELRLCALMAIIP